MTGATVTSQAASTPPAAASASANGTSGSTSLALPSGIASAAVSDEMRTLLDGQKKLHEQILKLQAQIEEEEAAYLEETSHGNIIRGWDGFIDSKQSRKDAALKKVKPYTEAEHLFSGCCFYKTLAEEPSTELIDYHPKDESSSGRRRAAGAGSASTSRPSSSSSSTSQKLVLERKSSISGASSTTVSGSATATPTTLGRPPKIKKRKRLDRLEVASTASANHSETGEDDEKETSQTSSKRNRALSAVESPMVPPASGTTDSGDFVDML